MLNHEIRSDGSVRLTGYVNAAERDSRPIPSIGGDFIECVAAGAFGRALERAGNAIELRFNHERTIGRRGRNLALREDAIGLYADAVVDDPEVAKAARDGRLTGWSFRFHTLKDEWSYAADANGGNMRRRRLVDMEIDEVSVLDVTPAYIATSVEMRSGCDVLFEERGTEGAEPAGHFDPAGEPGEPGEPGEAAEDADGGEITAKRLELMKLGLF